jgi:hypothetical protein
MGMNRYLGLSCCRPVSPVSDEIEQIDWTDEKRVLELGGVERVCDGDDAVHDGMDSAEIRVLAGSQPRKCKIAAWSDDSRIEGAGISLLQAIDMADRMIGGCGVVPPDRGSAGDCGRLWDKIRRAAIDNDGGVWRRGSAWPGGEQSQRQYRDEHPCFHGRTCSASHCTIRFFALPP